MATSSLKFLFHSLQILLIASKMYSITNPPICFPQTNILMKMIKYLSKV